MLEADLMLEDESRETAVLVATVIAVVIAALYLLSRVGFDNPVFPVANALGLSLFLVAAPLGLARFARSRGNAVWWSSQSMLAIWCAAVTMFAGIAARVTGVSFAMTFAIAGFVFAAWNLVRWIRRGSLARSLGFILAAAAFGTWCAGVMWAPRYKMPLFWETLALKANIHHDTFYYASMANMLDTYGIPTTGLDGIPLIRYHFGSTWLYAQWAHLLGDDVLTFYTLGYPIIVLPLFFSALLLFATELGAKLRNDWRVWVVFAAATVGFVPNNALEALTIWNSNALISESYTMGLAFLFLSLGAALVFWRSTKAEQANVSSSLFLIVFVPVAVVILGLLKISLMVLAFALAVYLAVRFGLYRRKLVIVSGLLSLIAYASTFTLVSLPAHNTGIRPLDFMRHNMAQGWQQFFLLFHLLWTWVYLGARLWEEGINDLHRLKAAVIDGRLIDAEAVVIFALIGLLPGAVVSIYGGSAVYFSDVQRWVALAFIMARMATWSRLWASRRAPREHVQGVRLSTVALAIMIAPFAATMLINTAHWPARVVWANLETRRQLASGSLYHPVVTALRDISRLPRAQRRQALLFIPQTNRQYWSMFTADGRCTFTPLIAPGIASVAMLDGMPPYGCKVTDQYNMNAYRARTRPQMPVDVADVTLCGKARSKGFREVIVLDVVNDTVPRRRRIDCYLQSQ